MAYYIGQLIIQNGEYSHTETVRFEEGMYSPDTVLDEYAKHYYGKHSYADSEEVGEKQDEDSDFWYFDCGCIAVAAGESKEVTKEVYEALEGMIPEITTDC